MLPAATHGSPAQVYTCRLCRRVLFSEQELEIHEAAQQSFRRRKAKGMTSTAVCSSFFLAEVPSWMEQQAGEVEGKLFCPNKGCKARIGSLNWTGAQCSCGSWVTPAIQFPKKNLDARSSAPAGPPPGTVVHSSLLVINNTLTSAEPHETRDKTPRIGLREEAQRGGERSEAEVLGSGQGSENMSAALTLKNDTSGDNVGTVPAQRGL